MLRKGGERTVMVWSAADKIGHHTAIPKVEITTLYVVLAAGVAKE
jgi:hypothetical protein